MTIEIKVPAMGESVTEATISKWVKKEGDVVKRDEPLLGLETDKVTVEVTSPSDGSIESISVQAVATAGAQAPPPPPHPRRPEARTPNAACTGAPPRGSASRSPRHAVGQAHL